MINLKNPIPEQIKDPLELSKFLDKYSIVPYFGYEEQTSHSIMKLIRDLSRLSPSHNACKRDVKTYAFSSEARIIEKPIPGLKLDLEVLGDSEAINAALWLDSLNISLPQLIDISRDLYDKYSDSGNAYLHIKIIRVGGTTVVNLSSVSYTQAAYLATKSGEDRQIIMTERWDESWWAKKPPTVCPASVIGKPFNWKQSSGSWETVVHFKNLPDKSNWYGFPPTLDIMFWMFVEFSQSDLAVKISGTEFVTKKIIAFEEVNPVRYKNAEDGDKEIDFRKRMNVLKKLTTNTGGQDEANSLAGIEYPYGQKPPETIDLEVNRDTKYADWVLNKASNYIYASHGWYRQLTGMSDMKSSIGGNIVVDLFNVANISTVTPVQVYWRNAWAQILSEIGEATGTNVEWTINFENIIGGLVENLRESKGDEPILTEQITEE